MFLIIYKKKEFKANLDIFVSGKCMNFLVFSFDSQLQTKFNKLQEPVYKYSTIEKN
uniref:Uncharacterized protein n=1 Tax=Promethearchaeum syntrophicum TaxID=2594042 RepID=A0A5B9DDP4_9ARCH|nr:hypothetical protein DSAG12_02740 [Candidatus Prometheoarchaeum syntrophicum]